MAAKHHITVAEIHENNAADLEKVTLIEKMNFEIDVNTYFHILMSIFSGKSTKQSQP